MKTISFDTIHAIVADHQRAEAARNAPAAVACRALDTLREALIEMSRDERMETVYLLGQVVSEAIDTVRDRDDRSWELTQNLSSVPF